MTSRTSTREIKMTSRTSTRERIKGEEKVAASSLRSLLYSIPMNVEDKVVLEDMVNKLSQEADTMLDIINDIPKQHQKQLLLGYKKLLKSVIGTVDGRLAKSMT
jgi:hypothetical protein